MSARPFQYTSLNTTNLTQVTGGLGSLAGGYVVNTNAAIRYIKFYSSTTAGAAPVVGTTVPWLTVQLPASSGTPLGNICPFDSITASGPLWFATTTGAAATDTTAVGAGDLLINLAVQG